MTYKNKTHVCDLCGLEFEYAQEYRDHTKTHGSYECVMCGKVIAKRGMLTQHYAKFHGLKLRPDSQHFCWICGKKYKSKPAVAYHITTAHSNEKLKCNKCDKTFGHVKNLKAHMKRHGDKNVACDKCPARFFTTSELGYHYNAVHQNARCWKCEICGTEFNRSSIYINHMEKHKSKRFECTVCFKMFHRKAHIEAHMKQHANPTDPEPGLAGKTKIKKYFRCNECSALFESEEIKRDHICGDRVRVIKRYMCDRCNFSFQCKEDLEAHTCSQNSSHILVQPENIAEDVQIYAEAGNLEPGSIGINTDEWETCFVVLSENGANDLCMLALMALLFPRNNPSWALTVALQVTRPREPGKRVPVLSWKMRLSMAELSRKSKSLPQSESQREAKKEPKGPEDGQELRAKRQYRKRPHIIHLCKFCMKVCPTGEKLKEHQRTHDSIECQFCGKVMARIGAWENHLKTFHNVEIQVPGSEEALNRPKEEVNCRICGKQFSSKTALAYHSKLHDGKTYTCDICGKLFNHPSNLKTHKLSLSSTLF
ncbi:zinc finger protein 28-like [Penaeus indicus]|uniref:zinc finger protein 28-like n=1 Tax=Penaeus indicus TaxID=29960 RepID=UPI00300C43BE